tara:strand:- start:88 stop:222 length:135 start_codon:yes stop_codon:yes gene_type:complete
MLFLFILRILFASFTLHTQSSRLTEEEEEEGDEDDDEEEEELLL